MPALKSLEILAVNCAKLNLNLNICLKEVSYF